MATNEIIFKVKADTSDANKNVKAVTHSIEELAEIHDQMANSNRDLHSTFEEVYGDIKPLSASLGELEDRMYQLALGGQQNSAEFKELQAEAVRFRQVLTSVDKSVDQLAEQGRGLGMALQLGTAVTAGYGAVQGGMALLGGESEKLQETFVKLQAVQTVLASLEQMKLALDRNSLIVTKARSIATGIMTGVQSAWTFATSATTTATVALKVAMLAIPIVAIIAGIMALVSAIAYFTSATETAEKANEKLNDSFAKSEEAYERAKQSFRRNAQDKMEIAKLEGATEEELHKMRLVNLSNEEKLRNEDARQQKAQIEQKRIQYKKALDEGNEDVAKTIATEIESHRKKYKDIRNLDGTYFADKKKLELEERNRLTAKAEQDQKEADAQATARRQKANENWNKAQELKRAQEEKEKQLAIERFRLMEDLMTENVDDVNLRSLMKMQTAHQRERQELVTKYGEDTALIKQLEAKQLGEINDFTAQLKSANDKEIADKTAKENEALNREAKANIQLRLNLAREDFEATQLLKAEFAQFEMEQELANLELTESEKMLIVQSYNDKIIELDEEKAERERQIREDRKQAVIQTYKQGVDAMQMLSDAFFGNELAKVEKGSQAELKIKKKQFEINKKLQIAQAIMQGVQGVQAAFSSGSAIPVVGAVTGPAFAALAGVQALLNVNKIKNTKFDGGGGAISTPSVTAPRIPEASSVTGNTENSSTLTTGLDQNPQQNIKVNVVDSEIKAVMNGSTKVQAVSTIG